MDTDTSKMHPLYLAALDADRAFHESVCRQFGKSRAGDKRYDTRGWDAETKQAAEAKQAADNAWIMEMRRS